MVWLKYCFCSVLFLILFFKQQFNFGFDSDLISIINKPGAIDGKYEIISITPIASGGFGIILPGKISESNIDVAIKIEPVSKDESKIKATEKLHSGEYSVFETIGFGNIEAEKWGVPTVYFIGKILNNKYHVVVMTRLDVNIAEEYNKQSLNYRTVLLIMLHSIRSLKFLHSKGVLHRDVKLENLMAKGSRSFLIDYNLAILMKNADEQLIGSWDFMSPTAHLKHPQTEVDDLISLSYVFMKLCGIKLPWENIPVKDHLAIYDLKMNWNAVIATCKSAKNRKLRGALKLYIMDVKASFVSRKPPDHDYLYKILNWVLCAQDECINDDYFFSWLNNEQREKAKHEELLPSIKSLTVPVSVPKTNLKFNDDLTIKLASSNFKEKAHIKSFDSMPKKRAMSVA